jgi:hypothetical protein
LQASTLAILLLVASSSIAGAARADCGAEVQDLKRRLPEIGDRARREEAAKLVAKAEKDARNGRDSRCADAAARAERLLGAPPPHPPPKRRRS